MCTPSPYKFLDVAKGYLETMEILSPSLNKNTFYSFGLVTCLAMETALKAALLFKCINEKELKSLGHDLEKIWDKASDAGIRINPDYKSSLEMYSSMENATVSFRYPKTGELLYNNPTQAINDVKGIIFDVSKLLEVSNDD